MYFSNDRVLKFEVLAPNEEIAYTAYRSLTDVAGHSGANIQTTKSRRTPLGVTRVASFIILEEQVREALERLRNAAAEIAGMTDSVIIKIKDPITPRHRWPETREEYSRR